MKLLGISGGVSQKTFVAIEKALDFAYQYDNSNDHYSNRDLVDQDVLDRVRELAESIVNFVRILPDDKTSLVGARGPAISRKPLLKKAS